MNPLRNIMIQLARISPRTMLVVILALSGGLTFLISTMLKPEPPVVIKAEPPHSKLRVVVCTHNVPEGTVIAPEDLAVQEVEASRAPVDVLTDEAGAVGHPAKFTITAGNLVSAHDLAPIEGTDGLLSKLNPGERALSMPVDNTTGVSGFVGPGSRVDVMVQVGTGADAKTTNILSDVRVLASGTMYQKSPGDSAAHQTSCVTVAVTPTDAGRLLNAMSSGKIYLALRNDRDHTPVMTSDVSSLFRKSTPSMLAAPLPPPIIGEVPKPDVFKPVEAPAPRAMATRHVEQWEGDKRNLNEL